MESAWNVEKSAWASERALLEQERGKWTATATATAGLEEKLEKERAVWEQEREELIEQAKDQIAHAADGLRALVQRFDIPLFSRGSGISVLVDALRRYLDKHNAQVHEELLVVEVDKRSAMAQELEAAKDEIQALQARSSSRVSTLHSFLLAVKNVTIYIFQIILSPFLGEHFVTVHGTQVIFTNYFCQRRNRPRRDTATTLGNITVPRSPRGAIEQCSPSIPSREWSNIAQSTHGSSR
jgi:predicted NBD/HSP70 family sugar kinase